MPLSVDFCNASFRDKVYCRNFGFTFQTFCKVMMSNLSFIPSRKHLGTKVTPDLHVAYSKNGGSLVIK